MTNELLISEIDKVAGENPAVAQWISASIGSVVNMMSGNSMHAGVTVAQYGAKWNEYHNDPNIRRVLLNIHENGDIVTLADGSKLNLKTMKDGALYVLKIRDSNDNVVYLAIDNKLKVFDLKADGDIGHINKTIPLTSDSVGESFKTTRYTKIELTSGDNRGNVVRNPDTKEAVVNTIYVYDYDGTLDEIANSSDDKQSTFSSFMSKSKNLLSYFLNSMKQSTGSMQSELSYDNLKAYYMYNVGAPVSWRDDNGSYYVNGYPLQEDIISWRDTLKAQAQSIKNNPEAVLFAGRGGDGTVRTPALIDITKVDLSQLPKKHQEAFKIYEEQNWMSKKVPTGINNKANRNGNVFHNADNLLPNKYDGYYREYYVMPKGHDGSKHQYRFVVGGMGEIYYTDNHYNSFVRLK